MHPLADSRQVEVNEGALRSMHAFLIGANSPSDYEHFTRIRIEQSCDIEISLDFCPKQVNLIPRQIQWIAM